ncbi:cyclin-domain-containing protein [Massarina eburnea CBS 473.64]|uniref:Cyclin-domain-containing protein n=1 Tax=Massarina eburnea CBS 473.64 TaxID=1395130 RepID=A0A6A6SDN5_9PLEO|nr:cyclin-domain-containing protein [Massarina eburnea CBS 473.64]
MGSLVAHDFGGNHFQSTMFGGGGGHPQTQESPAVHHTPARPSSQVVANPPLRPAPPPADVPMADSGAPPSTSSSTIPAQPSQQPGQQTPAVPSSSASSSAHPSPVHALRSPLDSAAGTPRRIKVKSLSHIQSFATDEASPFCQTRSLSRRQRRDPTDVGPQYEISEMPVSDIIEMVAGLLTKITTTNDRQHEHLHRQIPPLEGTSGLSQQTTSVLAFHGKNVPSISILSYLSRIHKYCPTTYEVFLSLLVYFDRMTEQSLERANADTDTATAPGNSAQATEHPPSASVQAATPPPSGSLGKPAEAPLRVQPPSPPQQDLDTPENYNMSHFFVVDSFNIHRLVIAGVTCASKFFSDVFYTNSRYAKVGGLPLVELNHLELQFLLLNDFRLAVPLEEMEAYGTMLVEFYAREVAQQHDRPSRS